MDNVRPWRWRGEWEDSDTPGYRGRWEANWECMSARARGWVTHRSVTCRKSNTVP